MSGKKTPKEKTLSDNVRKFLEKREAEDRAKKRDADHKKAALLEKRRENKKSVRTMNTMLRSTKSANKSALAEAKNVRDTAVTLDGRRQCDEDDYGYESAAAKKLYESLMNKYEKNPEDPMAKFAKAPPKKAKDLSQTMSRVKQSLENGDHDKTYERKQKSSTSSRERDREKEKEREPEEKRSKKEKDGDEARRKRLANAQKAPPAPSFEELMKMAQKKSSEPVKVEKKVVKDAEFDRPMTKKEKEEYLRERDSQLRKSGKLKPSQKSHESQSMKKPSSSSAKPPSKPAQKSPPPPPPPPPKKPVITGPEFHPAVLKSKKFQEKAKPSESQQPSSSKKRPRSPSPVRGKKTSNRIESDDDEEDDYDSELDDFIDDSDANMDISAQIRNIFGYDRRKFRDEPDFDDRSMENNRFADVMKEEARSAKIGMMEDLEDMRREEEEKKRKKMKKMRR